jgi:hypothetical protein
LRPSVEQVLWYWYAERDVLEPCRGWLTSIDMKYRKACQRVVMVEFWLGMRDAMVHEGFKGEAKKYEKLVRKTHRQWLREDRAR